jgi:hypothetical protein
MARLGIEPWRQTRQTVCSCRREQFYLNDDDPLSARRRESGTDPNADPRHDPVGGAGQASMTLQTDCWNDAIGLSAAPIELSSATPSGSATIASMNLP